MRQPCWSIFFSYSGESWKCDFDQFISFGFAHVPESDVYGETFDGIAHSKSDCRPDALGGVKDKICTT